MQIVTLHLNPQIFTMAVLQCHESEVEVGAGRKRQQGPAINT